MLKTCIMAFIHSTPSKRARLGISLDISLDSSLSNISNGSTIMGGDDDSSGDDSSESEAFFPSEDDSNSPAPILSSLTKDATTSREHELIKISLLLISTCCARECLLNLTASDVLKFRTQFNSLNQTEQRKWLTERLHENSHNCGGQLIIKYIISGMEVCKEAWCKVLNVSEKRVTIISHSMTQGQVRKDMWIYV